jgi:hypothetical protein
MLVISNGAGKCGSTWLASILLEIVHPPPLPPGFHDDHRAGEVPTIKTGLLQQFMAEVDYEHHNYVSKNGLFYERDWIQRCQNVRVVDIERSMSDMLISLFFHVTPRMATASIDEVRQAYWQFGPPIVEWVSRYHAVWRAVPAVAYLTSYERLREQPDAEIAAIARWLDIPLSGTELTRIRDKTRFERLAERWGRAEGMAKRFRKGIVGEGRKYFDDAILDHIASIEAKDANYPSSPEQRAQYEAECLQFAWRNQPPPFASSFRQAMNDPGRAAGHQRHEMPIERSR